LNAIGAAAMLASSVVLTAPAPAVAAELPGTLAEANAAIDQNVGSLNQQASDLGGQISEVSGTIGQLQSEHDALVPVLAHKKDLLKQAVKDSYIAGDPTEVEVLASNGTFSGVVGQQHYRDEISSKTKRAALEVTVVEHQLQEKLDAAKEKRDGLVALKGDLDNKIATAEAQAAAKEALARATQNKEAEYQKLLQSQKQQETAAIAAPSAAPSASPNSGPVVGVSHRSGNPYPFGQCTWYVYDATGRGQNGNAGSWRATSSTPGVGKIMIWRPGEQGASGAGHVGVVVGVSGNTVTIRHMNWNGFGVVSTGTFQSTGKFY
jgi:surface antigen